jgi:hypothetical protein
MEQLDEDIDEISEENDFIEHEIIDNDAFIKLIEIEHIIIDEFAGKIINLGKNAGIEKNKYWSVLNIITNEEYYIMNCANKLVKIDFDSIDKIKNYKYTWYTIPCGYCVSTFNKSKIYMHAYLMNHYGHGKGQLSVDHINKNIYDNRLLNLRIVTQSEQNINKSYNKQDDCKYNMNRPDGMENIILPRRMEYRLENEKCPTKDNIIKYRVKEYFSYSYRNPISKEIKIIKSSRSIKKSALEKYQELMDKLKESDIKVTYG